MRETSTALTGEDSARLSRRTLLAGSAAALAIPVLTSSAFAAKPDIHVAADGRRGSVATIAEALTVASGRSGPVLIGVAPGTYREKLRVETPDTTIVGLGEGVVITYAAGAQRPSPDGRNWGTTGSATLTIAAPDVSLRNLTIRNDHDYLAEPMQAVALAVLASAERCRVERCRLDGWQDTLLLQAASLVTDCRIAGNIDFVFGGAAAWIAGCAIVSRHTPAHPGGFVAAPSTPAIQRYGLVFARCRLEREAGVPDGSVFLGRPWRAGGNMALTGHAAFLDCWMDRHIAPQGWTSMGFRDPAGVQRQLEPLEARLFEWRSRGPGAMPNTLRRLLTVAEASTMTPVSVTGSWVAAKSGRAGGRG